MATLDELQQQLNALQQKVDAITAPPTDYYTQRYSGEETDRGVEIALGLDPEGTGIVTPEHGGTGADTTQAALAALGAGVQPNLLDNAIFVGGGGQNSLPINQIAGQPDRWQLLQQNYVEINESSITFTNTTGLGDGYYFQVVPLSKIKLGETYTASALFLSGLTTKYVTVVCFVPGSPGYQIFYGGQVEGAGISSVTFTVPTDTIGIEFRFELGPYGTIGSLETMGGKLEEGEGQTLAYQDSEGNWKLLPQPDSNYITQLQKCLFYFYRLFIKQYSRVGYGVQATSTTQFVLSIPLPSIMRVSPAVTINGTFEVEATSGSVQLKSLTVFSTPSGIETNLLGIAETNVSGALRIRAMTEDAYIDFNAVL